ncbi:MAG: PD-(D/E)XK nuclease family protein [Acidimicrobiales bacterium]
MNFVVRPWEREAFKRCRREWDFGATERQNYEPAALPPEPDLGTAVRDALAIYYFPGMWDWGRATVRPLVLQELARSLDRQRATVAVTEPERWDRARAVGTELLLRYFEWATHVDRFTPLQVSIEAEAGLPQPGDASRALALPDGRGAHFRARIDLVVQDDHEAGWYVRHDVVDGDWPGVEMLMVDDRALAAAWVWEQDFLAPLAGTMFNELRPTAGPTPVAARALGRAVVQEGNAWFRRTIVPRERSEHDGMGERLAHEVLDMTAAGMHAYPSPSAPVCAACRYRAPCRAMSDGSAAVDVLTASYRTRPPVDFQEGRLGGVWGIHTGPATALPPAE